MGQQGIEMKKELTTRQTIDNLQEQIFKSVLRQIVEIEQKRVNAEMNARIDKAQKDLDWGKYLGADR